MYYVVVLWLVKVSCFLGKDLCIFMVSSNQSGLLYYFVNYNINLEDFND